MNIEKLKDAVRLAARFRSKTSVIATISSVRLRTDDGRMRVAATNLDCQIEVDGGACEEPMNITVDPDRLMTALGDVDEAVLKFDKKLVVKRGRNVFRLACGNGADFPVLEQKEPGEEFPASLLDNIDECGFAAAKQDYARPYLNGVRLKVGAGRYEIMATTGLLAFMLRGDATGEIEFITPLETVGKLRHITAEQAWFGDDMVVAKGHGATVTYKVLRRQNPIDMMRMVPKGECSLEMPMAELQRSLREVASFSELMMIGTSRMPVVSIEVVDGVMRLARGEDCVLEIEDVHAVDVAPQDWRCDHLLALLDKVEGDRVTITWDKGQHIRAIVCDDCIAMFSTVRV